MHTRPEQQQPAPDAVRVEWRRLSPRLWVGRLDGRPLGMIEAGRRFTVTDGADRVRSGFGSLAQAQSALLAGIDVRPAALRAPAALVWAVPALALAGTWAGAVLLLR